jgi:spermidine synthase
MFHFSGGGGNPARLARRSRARAAIMRDMPSSIASRATDPPIVISEERGVRSLHFGTPWVQGAMRISQPWALELEYTRDLMLPLLLHGEAWPARVLQIGLGAASVTKFLYRHRPDSAITVVEIAPKVVETARRLFKLPHDPARIAIDIGDGRRYVAAGEERWDFIIVDGFDEKGRAGALDSVKFHELCRDRLAPGGMAAVNLLTRTRGPAASVARIREAYGERVRVLAPSDAGNVVVLAGAGLPIRESMDRLRTAARKLLAETGLNLLPALARLSRSREA